MKTLLLNTNEQLKFFVTNTIKSTISYGMRLSDTVKSNRKELEKGSVLSPNGHPCYTPEQVKALDKAEKSFQRSTKSAKTRYENAVEAI